jgi:hypothetical protein
MPEIVSHDDEAANAMLREQLCDFEQRLVRGGGEYPATLVLQNGGDVHFFFLQPRELDRR